MSRRATTQAIGIDPSLTGLAVCGYTGFDFWHARLSSEASGGNVYGRLERYSLLINRLDDAMRGPRAGVPLFLEGYSYASKGKSILDIAEFGGLLRQHLIHEGYLLREIAPNLLKKFATGKGNADKLAVALAIQKRYGFEAPNHDVAEAYCLCRMAACWAGLEKPETDFQRDVIGGIK